MPSRQIESLESRVFCSATPAEVAPQTAGGFAVSIVSSTIGTVVIGGKAVYGIMEVQLEGNPGYSEKGVFSVAIDAELNGVTTPIATVKRRANVLANGDTALKISVGPSRKISVPGTYAIYAQVKDPASVSEISAAGPALVAEPRTVAFSETIINSRAVSVFESDDYITGLVEAYTLQITNTGNVPTTGKMRIKLEQDSSTTAEVRYLSPTRSVRSISIPVGASRLITVKYKFTVGGVPATGFLPVLAVTQDKITQTATAGFILSG